MVRGEGGYGRGLEVILIKGKHSISPSVSFQCKNLVIGDGAKIHDRVTFLGERITIGKDVWIGQDSILDGTAPLKIGDNVTLGFHTSIFTHAATRGIFLSRKPVSIGSDSWVMSNSTINPGVKLGKSVNIYNNSLVTKSIPSWHHAMGSPARVIV